MTGDRSISIEGILFECHSNPPSDKQYPVHDSPEDPYDSSTDEDEEYSMLQTHISPEPDHPCRREFVDLTMLEEFEGMKVEQSAGEEMEVAPCVQHTNELLLDNIYDAASALVAVRSLLEHAFDVMDGFNVEQLEQTKLAYASGSIVCMKQYGPRLRIFPVDAHIRLLAYVGAHADHFSHLLGLLGSDVAAHLEEIFAERTQVSKRKLSAWFYSDRDLGARNITGYYFNAKRRHAYYVVLPHTTQAILELLHL